MEPYYLTQGEIANILNIGKTNVLLLIASEVIPFNRYHQRVIIKLEDLNNYIQQNLTTYQCSHTEGPVGTHKEISL